MKIEKKKEEKGEKDFYFLSFIIKKSIRVEGGGGRDNKKNQSCKRNKEGEMRNSGIKTKGRGGVKKGRIKLHWKQRGGRDNYN